MRRANTDLRTLQRRQMRAETLPACARCATCANAGQRDTDNIRCTLTGRWLHQDNVCGDWQGRA